MFCDKCLNKYPLFLIVLISIFSTISSYSNEITTSNKMINLAYSEDTQLCDFVSQRINDYYIKDNDDIFEGSKTSNILWHTINGSESYSYSIFDINNDNKKEFVLNFSTTWDDGSKINNLYLYDKVNILKKFNKKIIPGYIGSLYLNGRTYCLDKKS